jgi:hypothetical protein
MLTTRLWLAGWLVVFTAGVWSAHPARVLTSLKGGGGKKGPELECEACTYRFKYARTAVVWSLSWQSAQANTILSAELCWSCLACLRRQVQAREALAERRGRSA